MCSRNKSHYNKICQNIHTYNFLCVYFTHWRNLPESFAYVYPTVYAKNRSTIALGIFQHTVLIKKRLEEEKKKKSAKCFKALSARETYTEVNHVQQENISRRAAWRLILLKH